MDMKYSACMSWYTYRMDIGSSTMHMIASTNIVWIDMRLLHTIISMWFTFITAHMMYDMYPIVNIVHDTYDMRDSMHAYTYTCLYDDMCVSISLYVDAMCTADGINILYSIDTISIVTLPYDDNIGIAVNETPNGINARTDTRVSISTIHVTHVIYDIYVIYISTYYLIR